MVGRLEHDLRSARLLGRHHGDPPMFSHRHVVGRRKPSLSVKKVRAASWSSTSMDIRFILTGTPERASDGRSARAGRG